VVSRLPAGSYGPRMTDDLPPALLAVRHIGPRRARRPIDALGADWRVWLDQAPERVFGTLRGVGPRQAAEAAKSWSDRSSVAQSAAGRGTSTKASA
jgi:hypothetical protein